MENTKGTAAGADGTNLGRSDQAKHSGKYGERQTSYRAKKTECYTTPSDKGVENG